MLFSVSIRWTIQIMSSIILFVFHGVCFQIWRTISFTL